MNSPKRRNAMEISKYRYINLGRVRTL